MKKYAVMTTTFEACAKGIKSISDAVIEFGTENAKLIALCDTIEEAREKLTKFSPRTYAQRTVYSFYQIEAAYIEEAEYEYDEDTETWEFIEGSDIWDVSCEELPEDEEGDEE